MKFRYVQPHPYTRCKACRFDPILDCGREAAALTAGAEKAHGQKIADRDYALSILAVSRHRLSSAAHR